MSRESISQSISIVHPISLSHGKNAEVWDTTGKRYIDFVGGIGDRFLPLLAFASKTFSF